MILPAEIPYCAWVCAPTSETLVWHHSHTLFASFSHEKHSFPYKEEATNVNLQQHRKWSTSADCTRGFFSLASKCQ